jgi:hypothetical protein
VLSPLSCGLWNTTSIKAIIRTYITTQPRVWYVYPDTYTFNWMYRLFPKLNHHSCSLCLRVHLGL